MVIKALFSQCENEGQRAETAGLWLKRRMVLLCLPPCVLDTIWECSNEIAAPMTPPGAARTEREKATVLLSPAIKNRCGGSTGLPVGMVREEEKERSQML